MQTKQPCVTSASFAATFGAFSLARSVLQTSGMSEEAQAAQPPPQGNKNLLVVVLAFNVLIAGGLAYQVVMGQMSRAAAKAQAEHKQHEKEADKFGPLVEVGSLVANLNGPASGHYVKVALHIETTNEETKKKLEQALVPARAEALLYLSSIELHDKGAPDQMRAIQDEMKRRLSALLGKDVVKRVYFSEFVVQ